MFPSLRLSKNKSKDKPPASSTDIATTNNVSTGPIPTPSQPLAPAVPFSTPSMAFPENLYVNQRRRSESIVDVLIVNQRMADLASRQSRIQ